MTEYPKQVETIAVIFLGWLLGLLTPGIAERIRHPYRRRDLIQSVVDEMLSLQYTLALAAYHTRVRRADTSDAFLDEILPIVKGYTGPDRDESIASALMESRCLSEEQRAAIHRSMRPSNSGISLRQYALPLLITQMADLAICGVDFRRSVLHIRHHLDLFNQIGAATQALFYMTFNKPNEEDRKALIANHEKGCHDTGIQAEIIMRAITDLKKRYGRKQPA